VTKRKWWFLRCERHDDLQNILDRNRIETLCRFIQDQKFTTAGETQQQRQFSSHSFRQLPNPALLRKRELFQKATFERLIPAREERLGKANDPTRGHNMDQQPRSFRRITKQASAFVPMAMSLVALALVLVHVGLYGVAREADEGTVAHLWQILMVGQMPIVAFFAIKWLPRAQDKL
jgi:hypothetical protein